MGLDWNPLPKPKPGREAEFEEVFAELERATAARREDKATLDKFRALSDQPFALMGAPRVGFDDAANAWLRERMTEIGRLDELDKAMEAMHGYCVLALLPPCDGFPRYSNHPFSNELERYAFRASFLKDVEDVLGPELSERAYKNMLANDLLVYGEQLLAKATAFAAERGVSHVADVDDLSYDEDSDESRAHLIFAAAKWCLFWARRGHGLSAWY
jgi:hypothetical protein